MLNRKFASIRANVKVDRRSFSAKQVTKRMSQSQSMDMQSHYQRTQNVNNNVLMNNAKDSFQRLNASYDRRVSDFDSSPVTSVRSSPIMKSAAPTLHPYVNLLHQQMSNYNNVTPYQLQYQNNVLQGQSTPDAMTNQSWNSQSPSPLVTHYTAAQIYMRPKVIVNSDNQQGSSACSTVSKKPPPPEVPKRLSSTMAVSGSTTSLRKSNGALSRSSRNFLSTLKSTASNFFCLWFQQTTEVYSRFSHRSVAKAACQ